MSAVATACFPAATSMRESAIIDPSESPSGLRWPEIKIDLAFAINDLASSYAVRLSDLSIGRILNQNMSFQSSRLQAQSLSAHPEWTNDLSSCFYSAFVILFLRISVCAS